MRRQGKLYSEIASLVGISKSTAYTWTKDIVVSDEVQHIIDDQQHLKMKRLGAARDAKHEHNLRQLSSEARDTVDLLNLSASHERLLCAVFIWCEGEKHANSGLRFINSDPLMIATFLALLRSSFNLDETKFRALLHLHDYHDPEIQLDFWSNITKIPLNQFNQPYIKPHTAKRIHKNYPGCISIRYNDASLGKLLEMIYAEFSARIGV